MNFRSTLLILLLTAGGLSSKAQNVSYKDEFGFRSDNDAYLAYGQDRYYTNGLFITFRRAMDQSELNSELNKRIWEIEAGQKMYNPRSGNVPDISKVDRPFAAYLYAGGSLNWLYNSEKNLKVSLQVGTIGPSALGEDAQVFLHKVIGFYPIKGWDTQIKDEIGVNAMIEYNQLLHRSNSLNTDFTLTTDLNVGNTFAGGGAGILFRAGKLNQLFNSASMNSTVSNHARVKPLNEKEFFFYSKPALSYVAYDATTEGGLFRKDKGPVVFGVKPLVFTGQLGAVFSQKRWTADFSVIFKTREIKSNAKAHQYGSIALYYRFSQ